MVTARNLGIAVGKAIIKHIAKLINKNSDNLFELLNLYIDIETANIATLTLIAKKSIVSPVPIKFVCADEFLKNEKPSTLILLTAKTTIRIVNITSRFFDI